MSILIIDRATGEVTDRLLTGQFRFKGLDWARQGSDKIAFDDWGVIYSVDIGSETVVPVVGGYRPSWSPDNSKIVYLSAGKKPKPCIYEFSTGDIIPLTDNGVRANWQQ